MTREQSVIMAIETILGGYEVFNVPATLEEVIKDIEKQIEIYHILKKFDKEEAKSA